MHFCNRIPTEMAVFWNCEAAIKGFDPEQCKYFTPKNQDAAKAIVDEIFGKIDELVEANNRNLHKALGKMIESTNIPIPKDDGNSN